MGVPKKKTTRAKRGKRRAQKVIKPLGLSLCPKCKSPILPHTVCPVCGTYRGRQVIEMTKKTKKTKERKTGG